MRIIAGTKKGHPIKAPNNLPTRPTTDRSKESLFNILVNWYDFDSCDVLDIYAGTGNITYEFCSRGAKSVVCVDRFKGCTDFIKSETEKLGFSQAKVVRDDVIDFLKHCRQSFDIIFADPPFATRDYELIHQLVFEKSLLNKNGIFVMEHHSVHDFSKLAHFLQSRHYGQNVMSFYGIES
ncbi:16S rRNA (guanine(966)-N(2))-methyltransferase RsmD [bacterium]|nr:16S rRNA (guanine(966)-N(2))-methyltransferase RsmD [bacterium]